MYRSPTKKLAAFFEKSRDGWKGKCQSAREQNKLLNNQVRAVEQSREQWREKARQAQQRVRELERELEDLKCAAAGTGTHPFAR